MGCFSSKQKKQILEDIRNLKIAVCKHHNNIETIKPCLCKKHHHKEKHSESGKDKKKKKGTTSICESELEHASHGVSDGQEKKKKKAKKKDKSAGGQTTTDHSESDDSNLKKEKKKKKKGSNEEFHPEKPDELFHKICDDHPVSKKQKKPKKEKKEKKEKKKKKKSKKGGCEEPNNDMFSKYGLCIANELRAMERSAVPEVIEEINHAIKCAKSRNASHTSHSDLSVHK